jgi:hypothetical protein
MERDRAIAPCIFTSSNRFRLVPFVILSKLL